MSQKIKLTKELFRFPTKNSKHRLRFEKLPNTHFRVREWKRSKAKLRITINPEYE